MGILFLMWGFIGILVCSEGICDQFRVKRGNYVFHVGILSGFGENWIYSQGNFSNYEQLDFALVGIGVF